MSDPIQPLDIQLALALHQKGQWTAARAAYEALIAQSPQHFDAWHLLGVLEHQQRNSERAIALMTHAATLNPAHADVHFNLGVALAQMQQHEAAVERYSQAILCQVDHAKAWANRGMALFALGHWHQALESLEGALALQPQSATTHNNRGSVLRALGQLEAAIESFDRALALDPRYADAFMNKGNALKAMGLFTQAIAYYDTAIALNPHFTQAYSNRGVAFKEQLQLPNAIDCYDQALALNPQHIEANWNKALDLLLLGDFQQGWPLHEWRWQRAEAKTSRRDFAQPLWLGDAQLAGRTILLHAEQGFGDAIQFCRYATEVAQLGAKVILEVSGPLMPLMGSLNGVSQLVERGSTLPFFDCHCPLMSLPLALAHQSVKPFSSYLRPSREVLERWSQRLSHVKRPRVGLAWSGNAQHNNDLHRSVSLPALLKSLPDHVQAVSLQKMLRPEDETLLQAQREVLHFGAELHNFEETAALCAQMDLVISVDTSVAHLSGAIGAPTWVLLPYCPDWRWQLDRVDSPWYPSAQLYRQKRWGDWTDVWGEICRDLHHFMPLSSEDKR